MSVVIRIEGRTDGPTRFDGQYLGGWDFSVPSLTTYENPLFAMHFDTAREAMEAWRTIDDARPWRPDGKPNRPLTAFHVMFLQLDEALRDAERLSITATEGLL